MPEQYAFLLLLAGVALGAWGFLWLVVAAFRQRVVWGLAVLLLPPLALPFLLTHFRKAAKPLGVILAGALVVGTTYAVNYYYAHHPDLGPREKRVDGELHITLTGWDRTDYAVLETKPDTVVLQMANADVTDQDLEHLKGMRRLRELDLNDTQVTDAGLATVSELPQLQVLRLRKTRVTDQGFRDHLGSKDSLLELDLRETAVASISLREWKAKDKERRKYLR